MKLKRENKNKNMQRGGGYPPLCPLPALTASARACASSASAQVFLLLLCISSSVALSKAKDPMAKTNRSKPFMTNLHRKKLLLRHTVSVCIGLCRFTGSYRNTDNSDYQTYTQSDKGKTFVRFHDKTLSLNERKNGRLINGHYAVSRY
jgi:hypothetical protein